MSRSGYSDYEGWDYEEQWAMIRQMGALKAAIRGKRGQAFLFALRDALDEMPNKRLIAESLETEGGEVCALGALGRARGIAVADIDPEAADVIATTFAISETLARQVMYVNDDEYISQETPERRWGRVRAWVQRQIDETEQHRTRTIAWAIAFACGRPRP